MKNILKNISDLKNILKKEDISNEIFEIASKFGYISNALNEDDNLLELLNDIKKILKESLKNENFDFENKLELFEKLGALEHYVKNTKSNTTLDISTTGLTASAGARVLMGAGPMGMLAAGVLGVASRYILEKNEEPHIANRDLLTIAYYLSRFDHQNLFGFTMSSAKAIDSLGDVLNVKSNTIRGKRDYFDSLIDSKDRLSNRKGYSEIKSTKVYDEIIEKYSYITNDDEVKMRKIIVDVLEKYQNGLVL